MIDKKAAIIKTTEIRAANLTRVSGLPVRGFRDGKRRYFLFGPPDRTIKTVYTYRKARVFAEGVAIGRIRTKIRLTNAALMLASWAILFAALSILIATIIFVQ